MLFDFSLEQIPMANWEITKYTRDLHHSDMNEGNVMTEYEEKFSSMGNNINKLIANDSFKSLLHNDRKKYCETKD